MLKVKWLLYDGAPHDKYFNPAELQVTIVYLLRYQVVMLVKPILEQKSI